MATDVLQKEIVGLREDDINLLIEYARYLKFRPKNDTPETDNKPAKKRKIGFMAESFVSIAPDFDETPDCLIWNNDRTKR